MLPVSTRLLSTHWYIFKALFRIDYVVRLITITLILLSISVLGLHFYLLQVHHNSTAAAGTQSLNESWQVFSYFSWLTSCSHTTIKWIRRELHYMMSTIGKDWTSFLLLRVAMLTCDSIVYFIIIFGLCASALGVIGTNLNCLLFLSMPFNGYNFRCWK